MYKFNAYGKTMSFDESEAMAFSLANEKLLWQSEEWIRKSGMGKWIRTGDSEFTWFSGDFER